MPGLDVDPILVGDFPRTALVQYFQASEPEPRVLPFQLPRSIGPAGR